MRYLSLDEVLELHRRLIEKYGGSTFTRAWREPMFLTCLIFVSIFSLAVGVSTPNLGTISRYRIPLLPFFVGALTILEYHFLEFRAKVRQRRIDFAGDAGSLPLPADSRG